MQIRGDDSALRARCYHKLGDWELEMTEHFGLHPTHARTRHTKLSLALTAAGARRLGQ